jgi:CubicO group peptidase (beta-lactamase class C family)
MKLHWIASAAVSFLIATPLAAQMRTIPIAAEVESEARSVMKDTGARGLAVAIIDKSKVRSVQVFGERNAKGEPLTPDTIMYGASLTKAVFGYWIAMQVDRGNVDLDRPIASMLAKPLPEYGNIGAYGNWGDLAGDERWRSITPRHTLNHSTGFANFAFVEPDRKLRFHFQPGARYAYSGEGIMLLQFAMEADGKVKLGASLDDLIFKPLGMTNSSLMWRPDFAANLADGWMADGSVEPHDERSRVRAAGSMDISIADMAKMTAAMVRGWGLSSRMRREFTRGTLPITTRSQFPSLQAEAAEAQWPGAKAAMGVITFKGPQGPGFFKGGHNDSTANTMVCLERQQRCVLIMSNDVRAERKFPALVETLIGPTGTPWRWEYPDADY